MGKHVYSQSELALIEAARVPVAVYQFIDKRVVSLAISDGFCTLFGYDRSEVYHIMDTDMYRDTHPDDVARIADDAFRFATQGGEYNVVYRTKVNGSYRIIHAIGEHVLKDDGARLAVVWYTDEGAYDPSASDFGSGLNRGLTGLLNEQNLYHATFYDSLTGLPNMTHFFELAETARTHLVQQGRQPAILFMDFNGMKYFNGRFGFTEGNALIKAFSRVLARHFGNDSCSRFAQDHFAAIADAEELDGKLRTMLEECESINDGKNLPVRVGIYLDKSANGDRIAISEACDHARFACEVHREAYRSEFNYFDDTMRTAVEWNPYVISNIDQAISEGWIQVYYQPIVRAGNGLVCDEEALARWNDPVHGFLSPADFIPILEGANLIYKLDLFVVEQVLEKIKHFMEAGLHIVPQSVNLSRADFDSCDIVEEIRRRVDESRIPREKLTIEVTESVVGSDLEFMKAQVKRFQDLGFKVWMDDFGSGYSSFDVLQEIHFDLIKFDMSFLQRFDEGDESKIVLTELVKMAVGLGIDTLTEGVEKKEHAAFLQEVGCGKLQGYYYSKPCSLEEILGRYESGTAIGFEDPRESDYYSTIGRINLYDTTIMAQEDAVLFQRYFDALPMAIMEWDDGALAITRCNRPFRDHMLKAYGVTMDNASTRYEFGANELAEDMVSALAQCCEDGRKIVVDERMADGATMHAFVKPIAVNPVTGTTALAIVILDVSGEAAPSESLTYAGVAEALSADYIDLYSVDLETERFTQYSSKGSRGGLSIERHGEHFFQTARDDAMRYLYEDDRAFFVESFTKEAVLESLEESGSFTLMYRLMMDGAPFYANLKIVRMQPGGNRVVTAVSNIDTQVRQREALERAREERITYSRITALAGDYLCIYTVDPETDHYVEYGATPNYEGLGLSKEGEDFFGDSLRQSERVIHPDDLPMFRKRFTRESVLREIEQNGLYVLNYRLIMDGEIRHMRVKGAIVNEKDGPQLVMGVILIDSEIRRVNDLDA